MTRGFHVAFAVGAALLVAGIVVIALVRQRTRDVALINAGEEPRTGGMTVDDPRVLRADAQRNLARILEAAREVFAEHGIDAPRRR